jgi:3'-phosphoadenosine 5'-phosphosulfate sulfotransferase (PAPS reductase)/FAD synthetase
MNDKLRQSLEIYDEAMTTYQPYAVCLLLSGGDDSRLLERICNELGIKIDLILHGVTGTGIHEARNFVHEVAEKSGFKFAEANAGDAYFKYVMRKGFFGRGVDAHTKSYHVLKAQPFRTAISKNIRHGVKGRYILMLNGVRVDESENRADNLGDKYFNIDPAAPKNIWVNMVHWWTTKERDEYLSANNITRNPVSIELGRSGECMCGTMQSMANGLEAAKAFPKWGKWWTDIRKEVVNKFPWDWAQNINRYHLEEMNGQGNLLKAEPFMPMCVGCKSKAKKFKPNVKAQKEIITLPINEGLFKI